MASPSSPLSVSSLTDDAESVVSEGEEDGDSTAASSVVPASKKGRATTPPHETGKYRSQALRRKVLEMVGLSCLFYGLYPECTMTVAHWVPRCLKTLRPDIYYRLVAAYGSIVKNADNTLSRVVHFDCSGNQDVLCGTGHLAFDGTKGPGSGICSIIPLTLDKDMEIIRNNPKKSARQWFPQTSSLFAVHVYEGHRLPITILGPRLRSYAHVKPRSVEEQEAEDRALDDLCCPSEYSSTVEPEEISEECRRVTNALVNSKSEQIATHIVDPRKPATLNWVVCSHLNKAYVYTDIGLKLLYRRVDREGSGLRGRDLELYKKLWPTIGYWFEDVPPLSPGPGEGSDAIEVADYVNNGRRSERLAKSRSAPAVTTTQLEVPKKRKALASAPTVIPLQDPQASRSSPHPRKTDQETRAPTPGPSEPSPATTEEHEPPTKKRRRALAQTEHA
ncbi:uncharacterized protein SCHCODRAFT_02675005 [Schizophyllum commune H4-8]|uniref:Uncharacterized protein n=1 Tax=Schizophyllum commune (strain H4-8 / FGSC 9210) TaxID=578458 RepID=D8PUC0_SCHCM|nr:uncharacterized protein SCHCODRAFT_02675005 [Schizophyllum commune H4-8]KAI5900738.1 hypothetical protein SCHCODRAFT_02675005 [Schizophyllum commune H4-8]